MSGSSSSNEENLLTSTMIYELIKKVLENLSTISVRADEDSPTSLEKINKIADDAEGWIKVMEGLVFAIPLSSPLGTVAINMIFEDCPLPAVKTVIETFEKFELCSTRAASCNKSADNKGYERNILALLGCAAERYAGSVCLKLLTQQVIDYLFAFLLETSHPALVIQSLITIEKFAKTKENKLALEDRFLGQEDQNSLIRLERHSSNEPQCPQWIQIRFLTRWLLDNYFFVPGRSLTYKTLDMSGTNAIMKCNNLAEFVKVSPTGLEAWCDCYTYEAALGTFKVIRGRWYYEATVLTDGIMQIGWATKETNFSPHEKVVDDNFALTFEGCRRLVWLKQLPSLCEAVAPWRPGDVLGCLIDVERQEAIFAVNGVRLPIIRNIFRNSRLSLDMFPRRDDGFYAAATFTCFQAAKFNFGADAFRFAPTDRAFMTFNDHGYLTDKKKQVLPRWLQQRKPVAEDKNNSDGVALCSICCNQPSNVSLAPCRHMGYCAACAFCLRECPVCHQIVWQHYAVLPL